MSYSSDEQGRGPTAGPKRECAGDSIRTRPIEARRRLLSSTWPALPLRAPKCAGRSEVNATSAAERNLRVQGASSSRNVCTTVAGRSQPRDLASLCSRAILRTIR
jgi:hypothetical protein